MKRLGFWKRNRKRRALILAVTADKGPVYALVITDEIASRTNGHVKLKAGGIYPSLRRYEMGGWVAAEACKVADTRNYLRSRTTPSPIPDAIISSGCKPVILDRRRARAHAEGVQEAPEGGEPFYTEGNKEVDVTTQVQLTTADELLHYQDDGYRYELVKGELKKMAPAGNEDGMLALEFAAELRNFVKANKLGKVYAAETGFKLTTDPDTVRAPDVAFISQKRLDEVGPVQGYWPGAPDLAVEVISPNDLYTEVSEKVAAWLHAGSRMVVVVNPRTQQVLVHAPDADVKVLKADDTLDGGEVVPGWQLPVKELFES